MVELQVIKEYIDKRADGQTKKLAAKGTGYSANEIEKSSDYALVLNAMNDRHSKELEHALLSIQHQKLKAYSSLLSKGEEMINSATTTEEQIQAQENQRRNLSTTIVEDAERWNSLSRNQEKSDVLDGIIIE